MILIYFSIVIFFTPKFNLDFFRLIFEQRIRHELRFIKPTRYIRSTTNLRNFGEKYTQIEFFEAVSMKDMNLVKIKIEYTVSTGIKVEQPRYIEE